MEKRGIQIYANILKRDILMYKKMDKSDLFSVPNKLKISTRKE